MTGSLAANIDSIELAPTHSRQSGASGSTLLRILRSAVLLTLVMPLVVTNDTLSPYVVGKALYARCLIEMVFVLWLILIFRYPQHRPSKSWVLAAFGIWLLISLIAGLTGVSPVRSVWSTFARMQGLFDQTHWLLFALIVASTFRSFTDWRMLFTVNLVVCSFVSLSGLLIYYDLLDWGIGERWRISSTLGNAAYMGAYAMINVVIGLGLLIQSFWPGRRKEELEATAAEPSKTELGTEPEGRQGDHSLWLKYRSAAQIWALRLLWAVAVLLSFWALWMSGTRSSLLALGFGLLAGAVGYILYGKTTLRWRIVGGLLLLALISSSVFLVTVRTNPALGTLFSSGQMLQRLNAIGIDDSSTQSRIVAIDAGLQASLERPVLGWGPGNFLIAWGRHFNGDPSVIEFFDQAHNRIIEELVATGAVGLFSYILFWAAMIFVLVRSILNRPSHEQLFILTVVAAVIAYFVQNLFLFDTPIAAMTFAILLGFAVSEEGWLTQNRKPNPDQPRSLPKPWGQGLISLDGRLAALLRGPFLAVVALIVLIGLTGASLYYFNIKPYIAAVAASKGIDAPLPWPERAYYFQESIDAFPPLANGPRLHLIYEAIPLTAGLSETDFLGTAIMIQQEGAKALATEPQNWRIHLALAEFYQAAANRYVYFLEISTFHVDAAMALAPNVHPVTEANRRQEMLEKAALAASTASQSTP